MIDIIDICGWIGSASYAAYSVPQAVDAYKTGKTNGLSSAMIWLLFFGSLCSLLYVLPDFTSPLFYNFSIALSAAAVILKYHYFPVGK